MTFDEEAWPRLRFGAGNPLKVVVAQVRYPMAHGLADPAVQAAIQRALADSYPLSLDPVQEVTFAVTAQGPTPPKTEQTAIRFGNEAGTRVIAIGPGSASFETTRYEGWEAFLPEVERVLRLVAEHGVPTLFTRLGLRYVDELQLDDVATIGDWAGLLTSALVGEPSSLLRDPRVTETTQQGRLVLGEDELRFRHAYVGRPGETPSSVYVIDTDISTKGQNAWDIAAIVERLNRYHGWMGKVFGRSFLPEGLERLGGTAQ